MAGLSSNYNPDEYGKGFELMPEGVYAVRITQGWVEYRKSGEEVWCMESLPLNPNYANEEYPLRMWLPVDGVVEALADAAGVDPKKLKDREYQPEEFVNRIINVKVLHKASKKNPDKVFANIDRLHPTFNLGEEPPAKAGGKQAAQRNPAPPPPPPPSRDESFDDFDNGDFDSNDDIPF